MLVVKIGGTNGSGKTTLVRNLIHKFNLRPILRGLLDKKAFIYRGVCKEPTLRDLYDNIVVLGNYDNICGGMDTINSKEKVRELVHSVVDTEVHKRTIVIFEGLITGKTYGYLGALSETPPHYGQWMYMLMGTPYETCVNNILSRRNAKGNTTPFYPEKTVLPTYKACLATYNRAINAGHLTNVISYDTSDKMVMSFIEKVRLV